VIDVSQCACCGSEDRSTLGEQTNADKYLALVDDALNEIPRYWYKCKECEFVYRSPMISVEEANIIYSKYRSFEFRQVSANDYFEKLTSLSSDESETYSKAKFIFEHVAEVNSILDVGCGGGILLYQLRKFYPQCYMKGLEPNLEYAEMVRHKLHIDVIEEFYTEEGIEEKFDLTVSTNVIEHMHDFTLFWRAAATNIHSKKYLFVEIPSVDNFDSLDLSHDVFASPHLYFLSPHHVTDLAKNSGFTLMIDATIVKRNVSKNWFLFQKSA